MAAAMVARHTRGDAARVRRRRPRVCRRARESVPPAAAAPDTVEVPPPTRWAGAGVGLEGLDGRALQTGEPNAVTLRADMRIDDVIKTLLSSNALCVTSGSDEVFYVKLKSTEEEAELLPKESQETVCIVLQDLLAAPRQMPLNCLIGCDDSEECQLYGELPEPYIGRSAATELLGRLPWLVGLLAFLTVSSAILEYYDALLQRHLVIAFYLTALVGCGGNSGSQAASIVLQGLATGELSPTVDTISRVVGKELIVSFGVAIALSVGVFARIFLFGGPLGDAAMIAISMAVMVIFSVVFGAASPLVLKRLGADPAKVSGPLLSTVIDIFGVLVACVTAQLLEAIGVLH